MQCAKPVGRQAGGRRDDEACGDESRAIYSATGHSRTRDIVQAAWTVGAISDDRWTRWRCTGRRKDVRSGHGRRQLFEMRSDSTAARHGDVPTDLDPPYGSARLPSHLPGDLSGGAHEARGSV